MKKLLITVIFGSFTIILLAQSEQGTFLHHDTSVHTIGDFFTKSKLSGHVRNSLMATVNPGELKDYWTDATGGSIKLETPKWKGFQIGAKVLFTAKTFSSDLLAVDSVTGKSAKWEKELYDVRNTGEYYNLDILEELYIKYNFRKSYAQIGKFDLNKGPLYLARNGRMKPFTYQGFWSEINEFQHQKITIGWISGIAPRGMTEYFSMNNAIGMLNNGYHPNGEKADYFQKSNTLGIGTFGYEHELPNGLKIQYWNFLFHQLTDMHWLQLDYKKSDFFGGIQYVHQRAAAHQHDLSYTERYMQPDEQANVISSQFGYKKSGVSASLAYLHAFGTGRFMYPRELGRENFYVSQPRSWIDGFGDLNVYMFRLKYQPATFKNLTLDTRLSYTSVADRTDATFNKYKLPSFSQVTFLAKYKCTGALEGTKLTLLYVTKHSPASEELTEAQLFYRSGIHHFNLMVDVMF